MKVPDSDKDSRIQKLRLAIRKGDVFVSKLEKKGVDTSSIKSKLSSAKNELNGGRLSSAYDHIQEYISEMNRIKEKIKKRETEKKERKPGMDKPKKRTGRGKGVFALIRDDSSEKQMVEGWKELASEWRERGYKFEPDDKLFDHPFDEMEKRVTSIKSQVDKAEEILDTIRNMREDYDNLGNAYLKKLDDIERSVFRLERLGDIDKRLDSVERTFKSVDSRFRNLRNRINRYRRRNLETSSLEEILEHDEDLDYIEKQFRIYDGNVEFLDKEKKKLEDIKSKEIASQFRDEIREIEKIVDDPWKLDSLVEKTLSLEKEMEEKAERTRRKKDEEKRRTEIVNSLEKYREEGFKVDTVKQVIDDDINLLEEEYDQLIRNIAKMKELKEKLFTLNASGFEDDVARISEKVQDPSNAVTVERELEELKQRIVNRRVKSQKIESSIKRWTGMGFSVSRLENALERDINESEKIYEDYRKRIEELSNIEEDIKQIKHREVADQVHKLLLKIKNPELLEQVRREYKQLSDKVEELEEIKERRKDLNGLLKEWKNQGYEIERILRKMKEESTIDGIERIILNYTRSVASLKSIKAEFPVEERGWFPEEEKFIGENLTNLDKAKEVVGTFEELKEKNQKEEKRRGQISRKLDGLKSKNIDTSRIQSLLSGESSKLESEYENFIDLTKRLLRLKAKLLKESYKNKNKGMENLAKSMNDPYLIEEYERKIRGEKPAKPKRNLRKVLKKESPEENLDVDSLKDLAKTAYKSNKLLEALGLFEAVLSKKSDDKESQFYRKKVLLKLKQEKEAKEEKGEEKEEKTQEEKPAEGDEEPEVKRLDQPSDVSEEGPDPSCVSCGGTGNCSWCDGSGVCSTCNGTGKYFGDTCSTCKGSGKCSVCDGTGRCSWCNR